VASNLCGVCAGVRGRGRGQRPNHEEKLDHIAVARTDVTTVCRDWREVGHATAAWRQGLAERFFRKRGGKGLQAIRV